MTINQRVKQVRIETKLSQSKFSEIISISNGYIASIELEKRKVNERIIKLICSEFSVNENWLKTGEGQIFDQEKIKNKQLTKALEIFENLNPDFQAYALQQIDGLLELQKKTNDASTIAKP